MNQKDTTIDFSKLGGPVYVGRERGNSVRKKFSLDKLDQDPETVSVIVPDNTFSINPSFFLGLFGESIRTLGSREAFLKKYRFKIPKHLQSSIEAYISRALFEKRMLLGNGKK